MKTTFINTRADLEKMLKETNKELALKYLEIFKNRIIWGQAEKFDNNYYIDITLFEDTDSIKRVKVSKPILENSEDVQRFIMFCLDEKDYIHYSNIITDKKLIGFINEFYLDLISYHHLKDELTKENNE